MSKKLGKKVSDNVTRGRKSRNKGKRGERQLANMLKERGFQARRGVQFKGGLNSPDVICDALECIHFEAKWVESLNIRTAFAQAKKDAGMEKVPVVVHKKSHQEVMVSMSFFDWINMIQIMMGSVDHLNTLKRLIDEQRTRNEKHIREDEGKEREESRQLL